MLSTLGHASEVLDLFTTERPQWGVTATARELVISKSRAYDLLASLGAIGLLERVPRGRCRLGWRALALGGRRALRGADPQRARRPRRRAAASPTRGFVLEVDFPLYGDLMLDAARRISQALSDDSRTCADGRSVADGG